MTLSTRNRRALPAIVCAACTAIVLAAHWFGFEPLRRLEFSARDFLTRHGERSPLRPEIVFLAIDQESVSLDGVFDDEVNASPALKIMKRDGWPWSREVHAMVIERLVKAGARVVAFDMLFPTERPGDDALRAALERHGDKVVIGANIDPTTSSVTLPAPSLVPPGSSLDPRVGYVNVWPDFDGVVRRAYYRLTEENVAVLPMADLHSLAARILQKTGRGNLIPREVKCIRFAETIQPHSLWPIFSQRQWEARPYAGGELFRGKIVLIGPMGNWAKDVINTPFGEIPGPALHLQALNAALNGDFIRELSRTGEIASILVAGLVAWLLGWLVTQPFLRLAAFILASLLYCAVAWALFRAGSGGILLALAPPLLAANGSGAAWLVWEHVIERMEKNRTRRTLERYVSRDLVREILDNPSSYLNALGGERKSVAILFSDIRGFTTITEEADSVQLVSQLNEYLTEMVRCVFENKGTLDKFIGDAVMAVWGSIRSDGPAQDVARAVSAALQMQSALAALNARWAARDIRDFQIGIGINHGLVISGNIGSAGAMEKMDLTVIGDTVNLGSRLEGLTKEYGLSLLLGEAAADLVADAFHLQFVDLVRVKGKKKPIRVYTVLGPRSAPLPEARTRYLAAYDEAMQQYRTAQFAAAAGSFAKALTFAPDDPLAALYLTRSRDLAAQPSGAEWDGVFVMKAK